MVCEPIKIEPNPIVTKLWLISMLGSGARDSGVAWSGCCAVLAAMVLVELILNDVIVVSLAS